MTYTGLIKNGIAVFDVPVDLPDGTPVRIERLDSSFWRERSLDDLARDQCVAPIQSADELAGDWPAEDSIDEFLAFIREARH